MTTSSEKDNTCGSAFIPKQTISSEGNDGMAKDIIDWWSAVEDESYSKLLSLVKKALDQKDALRDGKV